MKHITHSTLLARFPEIIEGISTKDFGPLSFSYSKSANQVILDRVRYLDTLDLDATHGVLLCEQGHTTKIIKVTESHREHWLLESSEQLERADGLITNLKNVHLIVYTADCMSITFYDRKNWVIGIAHSGWRGTIGGISQNMLDIFTWEYGSDIRDIYVSVWPSIWPCCYSVVNPEQLKLFDQKYHNLREQDGVYYVDLWDSIRQDILSLGILEEHFENPCICTSCNHHLYASHRRDNPNTTTNLSVVSMRS